MSPSFARICPSVRVDNFIKKATILYPAGLEWLSAVSHAGSSILIVLSDFFLKGFVYVFGGWNTRDRKPSNKLLRFDPRGGLFSESFCFLKILQMENTVSGRSLRLLGDLVHSFGDTWLLA